MLQYCHTFKYITFIVAENAVLVLALIPLMLPDARSRADPDRIMYFTKV